MVLELGELGLVEPLLCFSIVCAQWRSRWPRAGSTHPRLRYGKSPTPRIKYPEVLLSLFLFVLSSAGSGFGVGLACCCCCSFCHRQPARVFCWLCCWNIRGNMFVCCCCWWNNRVGLFSLLSLWLHNIIYN